MKYYLKHYVGGFVDSYVTEEIENIEINESELLIYFKSKKYSHITGKAVNLDSARDEIEFYNLYSICFEYRLPMIKKGGFDEL